MNGNNIKTQILHETRELVFLAGFLTLFLNSLSIYRSIILNENIFNYFHIGYNFVEALLLSKIILLGKFLKLGERYSEKSLIIPTIYLSFVFSIFVFLFSLIEHFFMGFMEGKSVSTLLNQLTDQSVNEDVGKLLIAFLFFILLFSFLELRRVFGEEKFFALFFSRKP